MSQVIVIGVSSHASIQESVWNERFQEIGSSVPTIRGLLFERFWIVGCVEESF